MTAETEAVRPLSAIRGQPQAVRVLEALARSGQPTPPLLLHGPEGVGKATAARALAAALVCRSPRGADACGRCTGCRRVAEAGAVTRLRARAAAQAAPEIYPDVGLVGVPQGRTRISVLQARDVIVSLQNAPFELPRRVYVIDPADRMTPSAANALLKVLEEPPAHGVLVLVSASPWALPVTVRSRCRMVRFGLLARDDLVAILREARLDDAEIADRVALAGGSAGAALRLDPAREAGRLDAWCELLDGLARGVPAGLLAVEAGDRFAGDAGEAEASLAALLSLLRDVSAAAVGAPVRVVPDGTARRLAASLPRIAGPALARVGAIDDLRSELHRFNRNPRLAIEGAVLALAGLDLERSVLED
ncbi:MAG: AAA family ATPase [Acidobacteria bacterium]|nr:MAG: AAA family ATPase [Acidobacteriota bacterium]